MGATVQKIAESQLFKESIPLVAGESGISYEVKYVTVCNTPVLSLSNYKLEDSVFVLTFFSPYHNSIELMTEMVRFLEKQNISALCVKVDTYFDALPQEIADVCNELGLPLFVCDNHDIPFRKIILEIDKEIIGEKLSELEQSNRQYVMLYDNIMSGDNVDNSLKNLADHLNCRCAAISCDEKILGYYDPAGETHGETEEWASLIKTLVHDADQMSRRKTAFQDGMIVNKKWVFPCSVHNNIEGFLIIDDENLDVEKYRKVIQNTVTFVSVKLLESLMLNQGILRNNYQTIESLFYKAQDKEVIRHRLMLMGIKEVDAFRIVGFSGTNPGDHSFFGLQQKWTWINDVMTRTFQNVICFNVDDFFAAVIFYRASSKYNNDTVINETLTRLSRSEIANSNIKMAFSPSISEFNDFPKELINLRKNLKYLSVFAPSKQICAPNDMEQIRLVASIMDTDQYSYIQEKIIKPIQEYDTLYKSELGLTLKICLEFESLGDAANALYIHKSTLRYRLQKIAAITGENFFSSTGKFMLQVAFIAHQLEKCR